MPSWNSFTVMGHVGRDPDYRPGGEKTSVCTFSVAENQYRQGQESTAWWRVVCFGQRAERAEETIHSGDLVLVQGHLLIEHREEAGVPRDRYELLAQDIRLVQKRGEPGGDESW